MRLGNKIEGGGVESTGPHGVVFVSEPTVVMGKDDQGKPRKEMRFVVEEKGIHYRWNVPIMNKEGQPSYLIEKLMNIEVGDKRVLEMSRQRGRNYIDVRGVDEKPPQEPSVEEDEDIEEEEDEGSKLPDEEEIEKTLEAESKKQNPLL